MPLSVPPAPHSPETVDNWRASVTCHHCSEERKDAARILPVGSWCLETVGWMGAAGLAGHGGPGGQA